MSKELNVIDTLVTEAADERQGQIVEFEHFRLEGDFGGFGNEGVDNVQFFAHDVLRMV